VAPLSGGWSPRIHFRPAARACYIFWHVLAPGWRIPRSQQDGQTRRIHAEACRIPE
jgi:hypothetical protein